MPCAVWITVAAKQLKLKGRLPIVCMSLGIEPMTFFCGESDTRGLVTGVSLKERDKLNAQTLDSVKSLFFFPSLNRACNLYDRTIQND
ncbi:unnamed protein product [Arctogadus glacialis]